MAEVSPAEAIAELESVMAGTAEFVKRMLLQITLPDGRTRRVLNDVVIHWGGIARLIDLGLRMGRSREIELRADGLIVSTPVGSSAYSYAASGPLVHPEIEGILLTPICPYVGPQASPIDSSSPRDGIGHEKGKGFDSDPRWTYLGRSGGGAIYSNSSGALPIHYG